MAAEAGVGGGVGGGAPPRAAIPSSLTSEATQHPPSPCMPFFLPRRRRNFQSNNLSGLLPEEWATGFAFLEVVDMNLAGAGSLTFSLCFPYHDYSLPVSGCTCAAWPGFCAGRACLTCLAKLPPSNAWARAAADFVGCRRPGGPVASFSAAVARARVLLGHTLGAPATPPRCLSPPFAAAVADNKLSGTFPASWASTNTSMVNIMIWVSKGQRALSHLLVMLQ